MGWWLFNWLKKEENKGQDPEVKAEHNIMCFKDLPDKSTDPVKDVVYPPRDSPVPVITTNDVICTQVELIRQLKESIPLDEEEKDKYLFPVIRNLADYVHLLPASQSHHHNGRGGLFRHSLEVSLYSVRMGKMRIFDVNADPVASYHNKGRWYLAIAIAGMMHDIGKCITDMTVTASDGSDVWMPSVQSLSKWIEKGHYTEYYLAWNIKRIHGQHENASLSLLNVIVPTKTRQYLEESHSAKLKGEFYEALSGTKRKDSVIAELVAKADAYSTQQDLNRQIREGLHPGVNAPIATHVINIVQELVESGEFIANKRTAPLIVSDKGIFMVWSRAVGHIFRKLSDNKVAGVPKNEEILAEKLCESGICEMLFVGTSPGEKYWSILPACDYTNSDPDHPPKWNYLNCLKLSDDTALYANVQRPANTLVLLRQVPTSEEEKVRWREITKVEPPHGQDWITSVLAAEQDRDAHSFEEFKDAQMVDDEGIPIFDNDYNENLDSFVYPTANVKRVLREMGRNEQSIVDSMNEPAAQTEDVSSKTQENKQVNAVINEPKQTYEGFFPAKKTKQAKAPASDSDNSITQPQATIEKISPTQQEPSITPEDINVEEPLSEEAMDAMGAIFDESFTSFEEVVQEGEISPIEPDDTPTGSKTKPDTDLDQCAPKSASLNEVEPGKKSDNANTALLFAPKSVVAKKKPHRAGQKHKKLKANAQAKETKEEVATLVKVVEEKAKPNPIPVKEKEKSMKELSNKERLRYTRELLEQLREELKKGGGFELSEAPSLEDDQIIVPAYPLLKRLKDIGISETQMQSQLTFVSNFPRLRYDRSNMTFSLTFVQDVK